MARAKRSRAEWLRIVSEWRCSGETAERFAKRRGLNVGTLRVRSSQLGREAAAPAISLVPIEIAPSAAATRGLIELELGALRVRAEVGTDPRYVAALMRALAEAGAAC